MVNKDFLDFFGISSDIFGYEKSYPKDDLKQARREASYKSGPGGPQEFDIKYFWKDWCFRVHYNSVQTEGCIVRLRCDNSMSSKVLHNCVVSCTLKPLG